MRPWEFHPGNLFLSGLTQLEEGTEVRYASRQRRQFDYYKNTFYLYKFLDKKTNVKNITHWGGK